MVTSKTTLKIAVVGGAGHVGLPLSLMLASKGFKVSVIDIDKAKLERIRGGEFPFVEEGGQELLKKVGPKGIEYHTEHKAVASCDAIILTVGTPLDDHLNPHLAPVFETIEQIQKYLHKGQVLILRSTLFPGTSEKILTFLKSAGLDVGVSFCPERIAQGLALKELVEFPQIISGSDGAALAMARRVFNSFASEIIELSMTEAEVAKLFTNSWRYIKFAVANQMYMMASEKGLDFYKIRDAMTHHYRRTADFPIAGFAAGPCLFKDTMQLAAYSPQGFSMGHSSMLINESLPSFLVEQIKRTHDLSGMTVGILGMAFKPDNDDHRDSLAYKLRRLLQYENATVLCADPFIKDDSFVPLEKVLSSAKLLVIGCPHSEYRQIDFSGRDVVDCWGLTRSLKVSA